VRSPTWESRRTQARNKLDARTRFTHGRTKVGCEPSITVTLATSPFRPFQSAYDCGYIGSTLGPHNLKDSNSNGQSPSEEHRDPARWAQHILTCIGDAIISTDVSGKITYLNPAAERMTGWSVHEALGLPMAEVMRIIDVPSCGFGQSLPEAAIERNAEVDLAANRILVRRDGIKTAIEDSVAPIRDQEGRATGAVIVFRALTEEALARTLRISRLAQYDCLTGLPNRLLLNDRLGRAIALSTRHRRPLAVLFVDLDHFKDVNDTAGHAVGDRVLQVMAKRMQASVRSSDTVSRYGGDEFVVLLSEIDQPESLMPVARKILTAVEVPHNLTPHVFRITASIGVSFFPQDGQDGESLIQNADAAMYCAKQNGGNRVQLFAGSRRN
jgi:diguanylate cyclase (GGDEF)-like protein/PAS domain S-box-containing protein